MHPVLISLLAALLLYDAFAITCHDFVSKMEHRKNLNDYSFLIQEEQFYLHYSATLDTLLGQLEACNKNPSMKHLVAVIKGRANNKERFHALQFGACLPRDCLRLESSNDQPFIRRIFDLKGWPTSMGGGPGEELHLYNPEQNITTKPVMFYITCALLVDFVLFGFISTIANFLKSNDGIDGESKKQIKWFFECFDIKKNALDFYKIAGEQKQNENLAVFQFLRLVMSYWVLSYHHFAYFLEITKPLSERETANLFEDTRFLVLQENGDLTIEYFFMMTGFFAAYVLTLKLTQQDQPKSTIFRYWQIIRHRWLRLGPVLLIFLLGIWFILPYASKGSLWHLAEWDSSYCDYGWWHLALLINNIMTYEDFRNFGGQCFGVAWYINIEFQMYAVAIIVFIIYAKYRKTGLALVIFLVIQSLASTMSIHLEYKIKAFDPSADDIELFHRLHKLVPYRKWYTFYWGALWGLLYFEYNKLKKKNLFWIFETKPILSYITIFFGFALTACLFYAKPYIIHSTGLENADPELDYLWLPLRMFLSAVFASLIFMPLISNRKFYLKTFFNLRIFQVLGKTTYVFYLVHIPCAMVLSFSSNSLEEWSWNGLVRSTIKTIAWTQLFAILIHLLIEKPILNLITHFEKRPLKLKKEIKIEEQIELQRPEANPSEESLEEKVNLIKVAT